MENNYVMSTSVLQYLEDMRAYIKDNYASKSNDNFDLLSTDKLIDGDEPYKDLQFDNDFAGDYELAPRDGEDENPVKLFESKLSLDEPQLHDFEMADKDADLEESKDIQDSSEHTAPKETRTKSDSSNDDKSNDASTTKGKKPRLSNKERARKARQRKKKYYEDLEKRAEYLENKCTKLTKELEY
jgi:hypothetical protein